MSSFCSNNVDYSKLNLLIFFLQRLLWESKFVAVKDVESAPHQKRTLGLIYAKHREVVFKQRKNHEKCRYDKLSIG